jgi:hypothetical protein
MAKFGDFAQKRGNKFGDFAQKQLKTLWDFLKCSYICM